VASFDRSEVDALIDLAGEQIVAVRAVYEETLAEKQVSAKLRAQIKNVVENQRSALEYIARAIVDQHGKAGAKAYYPITRHPKDFPATFGHTLPGVSDSTIRDAIEARQPYQAGYEWLGHLATLTNTNKHERLTPQKRDETRRVRVDTGAGSVEYVPYQEGKGGVTFGPGVFMGGVPVDPGTQRPVPSPTQTVTETVYVDWLFEDPHVSVLATLERIQSSLPALIDDVLTASGL
jgi:hypothetical protein